MSLGDPDIARHIGTYVLVVVDTQIAGYALGLGVDAVVVMCAFVVGPQFRQAVFPAKAAREPCSALGGGATAGG
jgi:hypothetical protein